MSTDPDQHVSLPVKHDRRQPHPAPLGRRLLMLLIVLCMLGGFTVLVWLIVEVKSLGVEVNVPTDEDIRRAVLLLRTLAVITSISVAGIAIWIGHFAWRVRKAEVFPPPGSRQLRVQRVRRGPEARRIARLCFVLAVLLLICGASLAPLVFELAKRIGVAGG